MINSLNNFYLKTIQYDLINKFPYNHTKKLPKFKKIILNFECKTNEIKMLTSSLVALKLITNQKGILTATKRSNVKLKIRKGNPVGCKVTLRKTKMFLYLYRMVTEIFPRLKNFNKINLNKNLKHNAISYKLDDIFNFKELEKHYYLFNNLTKLSITLTTNTKTKDEFLFIFHSLKFPIKNY